MNTVKRRLLNNNQSIPIPKQYDDTRNAKSKLFYKPMSASYIFSIIILMMIVFSLVIVIEKQLPIGKKTSDEDKYPNSFIAERAYRILKNLTRIGPRIAGSYENEVLAVKVLTGEIDNIVKNAHSNHKIEVDIQKASGAFNLEFLDGMTNVYQDVQNVVVKVGSRIDSPHSLLINCHFDSVFDSPGASDDGANCAVMLEILRVLTKSERILRHNIIFLFNGGEENFMPASHGFITQHKWAKEIRAFINMEACGAGGREVLFQAGPNHPWILETYSEEVPYPYASSLAQEIFQSGVIPGDTDYRIFRDFGNISGLDFAWSANGYVYHTKFDRIEQIPLGSLQRTGDNILALAKGMAQGHQLSNVDKYRAGNLVFFDFLGAFVVRWTMPVADVINVLSVIFSLFTLYSNIKDASTVEGIKHKLYITKLVNCMIGVFLSWILPIIFCLAMAAILTLFGRSMSWYARPLWAFFIYVIPTFVISLITILVHAKYYHKDLVLSPWAIFQLYYDAYQTIWTVFLLLGICVRIRSSFIALTWVFFFALGNILKSVFCSKWRDPKRWLLLHILSLGLPFVQCFYLIIGALYLFIPIMGRAGAGSHAELLIAVMMGAMFSMLLSGAVPLILLVRRVEKVFSVLIGVYLISLAVLILTPAGFPYSGENGGLAPQRFMIAHTKRTFHDSSGNIASTSNGYWIVDMDVNSPHTVDNHVPQMQHAELVDRDCIDYVYCGLPYLVPVLTMIWKTHWIPGPEPDLLRAVNMSLDRQVIDGGQRISLHIDGPTHIGVIISPTIDVTVSNWSLPTDAPLPGPLWNGRQTYFIYYAYGLDAVPLRFSIDFKVPQSHSGPIMDLAVTSHYLFGSGKANKEFRQFIDQFPNWSAVNYWTATYESWIV